MNREQLEDLRALARRKGSNEQYLAWLRKQPSCLSDKYSEWVDGDGRNPACHVRRAVDSGTAHKPDYSAVPLTHEEHADQTNRGEAYCLGRHTMRYPWALDEAKEFFDGMVALFLLRWLHDDPIGF